MKYTHLDLKNLPEDLDPKAFIIINNIISHNSYLMGTLTAWRFVLDSLMPSIKEGELNLAEISILSRVHEQLKEILAHNLDPEMLPIIESASALVMKKST